MSRFDRMTTQDWAIRDAINDVLQENNRPTSDYTYSAIPEETPAPSVMPSVQDAAAIDSGNGVPQSAAPYVDYFALLNPGETPASALESKLSQMQSMPDLSTEPVSSGKWWAGDRPTYAESVAQLYRMQDSMTPEQFDAYAAQLDAAKNNPASGFYHNPYTGITSPYVEAISKLGIDVSGGINDEWIAKNQYLLQGARYTDAGTTPAAPTKTSTAAQNAAYYYYQIQRNYADTKEVLNEVTALKDDIAYWAGRDDLNLSDDQILERLDWDKKYKYLKGLKTAQSDGHVYNYTSPIDYNPDNLRGYVWAARNNGGTGNPELDAVNAALGRGNVWKENKEISDKLDFRSENYSPYSVKSTLDDAARHFGVREFEPGWAEKAAKTIVDWDNPEDVKYWQQVAKAETFTAQAQAEVKEIYNRVDTMIAAGITDPAVIADGLWDKGLDGSAALTALKKLDASMVKPSEYLEDTTRPIDYRKQDVLDYINQKVAKATEKEPLPAFGMRVTEMMGTNIVHGNGQTPAQVDVAATVAPTPTPGVNPTDQPRGTDISATDRILNTPAPTATTTPVPTPTPTPTPPPVVDQTAQAVNAAQTKNVRDAAKTILATGTPDEKMVLSLAPTANAEGVAAEMAGSVQTGTANAGTLYETTAKQANDFTANHYVASKQAVSHYDEMQIDLAELNKQRGQLVSEANSIAMPRDANQRAHLDGVLAQIHNLDERIEKQQQAISDFQMRYNQAQGQLKAMDSMYDAVAAQLAMSENPGIDLSTPQGQQALTEAKAKVRSLTNSADLVMSIGSQYTPTEWAPNTVFQYMTEKGANLKQNAQMAQQIIAESTRENDQLNRAIEQMQASGMAVPGDWISNVNRYKEKNERDIQEAKDFLVQTQSGFEEAAAKGQEAVRNDKQHQYSELSKSILDPGSARTTVQGQEMSFVKFVNAMTDDEKKTYAAYLAGEGGEKAAVDYFERLTDPSYGILQTRVSGNMQKAIEDFSEKAPGLAFATSIAASPLTITGAGYTLYSLLAGKEINPNNEWFYANTGLGTMENVSKEAIKTAAFKKDSLGYNILGLGLDGLSAAGKSTINSLIMGPLVGGITNNIVREAVAAIPMALQSAGATAQDVKARRGSDLQAALESGLDFTTNVVTEALTYGNIEDAFNHGAEGVKAAQKSVLKNPWIEEMLGEGAGYIADYVGDDLIMGKLSEREQKIAEYEQTMKMSHDEAVRAANYDFWKGLLYTELATAVSTTASQGASYAAGRLTATPNTTQPSPEGQVRATALANGLPLDRVTQDMTARTVTMLTSSLNADKGSQVQALSAALFPVSGDAQGQRAAISAGLHMANQFGSEQAVAVAQDVILSAAQEGADQQAVSEAMRIAALGQGEASVVLNKINQTGVEFGDVQALVDAAGRDAQNPAIADRMNAIIHNDRVASRTRDLIGQGALNGVRPYEQAYSQAKVQEAQTQQNLEAEQKRAQAMGEHLQTVQAQHVESPSDQALAGAMKQAVKDVAGQVKVVGEYQQGLEDQRQKTRDAEKDLTRVREEAMTKAREQALADVRAEELAEAQAELDAAKAKAEAEAEAKRQAELRGYNPEQDRVETPDYSMYKRKDGSVRVFFKNKPNSDVAARLNAIGVGLDTDTKIAVTTGPMGEDMGQTWNAFRDGVTYEQIQDAIDQGNAEHTRKETAQQDRINQAMSSEDAYRENQEFGRAENPYESLKDGETAIPLDTPAQMPYTKTNEVNGNGVQSGGINQAEGLDAGQLAGASGRDDRRGNSLYVGPGAGREANNGGNEGVQSNSQGNSGSQTGLRLLNPESRENLKKNGVTDQPLYRENDRQRFSSALAEGRASNENGVYVDNQTPEDLERKGAITILSEDGLSGAAVGTAGEDKGNIFAVFKHKNSKARHAATSLMIQAIAEGGNKLDCYAGRKDSTGELHPSIGLAAMYARTGFIPVARVTFADGINEEWNADQLGRPPIIFWMHNGDSADVVARKQGLSEADGGYHVYTDEELMALPLFDDITDADGNTEYGYDRAWAYRDQLLEEAQKQRGSDDSRPTVSDNPVSTPGDADSSSPKGTSNQHQSNIQAYKGGSNQGQQQNNRPSGRPKKSPQRIAKDLTNKLNIGQAIGTRKMNNMPQEVAGYYERRARYIAVRNRYAGNYVVTMHEIGHGIANRIGMTGTQDMVNNLDPVFAANYSAAELPGEAFAEFMWRYMESEENGRAFAGDAFVDDFEQALRDNGLAKDVHDAATQLRAWVNASAFDQIRATIRERSDHPKLGFREQFRRIIDGVIDQSNAAEAVNHEIRRQTGNRQVAFDQDVRENALMKNQAGNRAFHILTEGMTDANWTRTGGDSLAKVFSDAGLKSKDVPMLESYMLALHSQARDAQGKPVFDDHITPAARQAFIDDVRQNHPEVARAEEAFQAWRKDFLQRFLVDTGYLSQEAFDRMNAMYEHYVPTMRVKDERYRNMNRDGGKTYQVRRATGSTEDIWSPMDTFVGMVNSIVNMVSANNAALAWENAYQNNALGMFGREITPDSRQVTINTEHLQQQLEDLLSGNVDDDIFQQAIDLIGESQSQWQRQNGSNLPNVITVQHADGSKSHYEIFDTELYKLLASVDNSAVKNRALSVAGMITRGMAALTTGSNPVFAARNFMRDFQNSVNYGSWASNYATGTAKWLRAAYDVWKGEGEYQDYAALGGGGWTRIEPGTRKGAAEYRSALYQGYNTENIGRTAKYAGQKLWNAITLARLNEIVEQTSRYAEYKYGKHDKNTAAGRAEAFRAAQEATVDFSRSGNSSMAGTLKQLVPFFNASMQGVYRTGRSVTEAERGRAAARFTKTVVNTALLSALCNALLLKNSDDDEKKEFAMMSDELKAQHFYLPNFAPGVLGQQPLLRIPLSQDPLTYAVHGAVTNAMWNGTTDEAVIDLAAVANTILDNLNPLGSGTVFQPFLGIGQNKNWYGSRIVPTRMADWDKSTQYTEETPDIFIQAGRMIGGLAPDSPFASPLNLQYLAEQYTGFLGQMLIPAFSKNEHTGELGGWRAAITAAQKRLTSDPLVSNDVVSSFYDGAALLTKVTGASKNERPLNMLRRGLTPDEATAAYKEAQEMSGSTGIIGSTKATINSLYDEIDKINANDTLTDEQKYILTSEKRREMIAAALVANEAIGAYREKYVTGENVANRMLFEGVTTKLPTAYDNMPQTFKDDENEPYMQKSKAVYEATGKDAALPHPQMKFTSQGVEYEIAPEDQDTFNSMYKTAYSKYIAANSAKWDAMTDDERLGVLNDAHNKARDTAKGWYKKKHNIK